MAQRAARLTQIRDTHACPNSTFSPGTLTSTSHLKSILLPESRPENIMGYSPSQSGTMALKVILFPTTQRVERHPEMLLVREGHQEVVDQDLGAFRLAVLDDAPDLKDVAIELAPRDELPERVADAEVRVVDPLDQPGVLFAE